MHLLLSTVHTILVLMRQRTARIFSTFYLSVTPKMMVLQPFRLQGWQQELE